MADFKTAGVLPVERLFANVAIAETQRLVFLAGGIDDEAGPPVEDGQIYVAQVLDDGTLSAWRVVGQLAVPRYGSAMVIRGNQLYVIGGDSTTGNSASVEVFRFDQLGNLTVLPALPFPVQGALSGVVVRNDEVFVFYQNVYLARFNGDGTLTNWKSIGAARSAEFDPGSVAEAFGRVYWFDGTNSGTTGSQLWSAPLNSNDMSAWRLETSVMPFRATYFGTLFRQADKLYYLGAWDGSADHPEVWMATVTPNGIGEWSLAGTLPKGMARSTVVTCGNYLYAFGGEDNSANGITDILVTRVTGNGTLQNTQQ